MAACELVLVIFSMAYVYPSTKWLLNVFKSTAAFVITLDANPRALLRFCDAGGCHIVSNRISVGTKGKCA